MTNKPPRVYISYSRDSNEHVEWVTGLARGLRSDGVDAVLDIWALQPGMILHEWVAREIAAAEGVIVIVSRRYMLQSKVKGSGVALDVRLLGSPGNRKKRYRKLIVPIVLPDVDYPLDLPNAISGRYGIRFEYPDLDFPAYEKLLDAIFRRHHPAEPPLVQPRERGQRKETLAVPVTLARFHIEQFRRLDSLVLERVKESEDTPHGLGQWTLLLGDNGMGKSSILWALGLALLDGELAHGLLANLSSPLVRGECGVARISVDAGPETFGVSIENVEHRERVAESPISPDFMVFGYGSARGSAFGGPNRAVELDRPLDAISTLYGLRTSLIHAETWLRGLEHSALKSGEESKESSLFASVCSVLKRVLPGVDEICIDSDRVVLSGPALGTCGIASLSDGYATTLGWLVDMMARWLHEQKLRSVEIKANFNEEMIGLVLIDELDLHLHPRWQMRIVDDIRLAFPRMSFVATTHNPLTLLGAKPGEIHVLDYTQEKLNLRQVDLPPGIRADQVLTGVWFGLSSTLDEETQGLLDQHRSLLRAGTPRTDAKRLELEHRLRLRLGSYADTSEDRLAQEIVSNELVSESAPLTRLELEAVRDKVHAALASKK